MRKHASPALRIGILGGGLSGLALAYFLEPRPAVRSIEIIEKEDEIGGLCRSFGLAGVPCDIGPHILFSKDGETLGFIRELLGDNQVKLRRSNKILYKGRLVKYPFENELSALPERDKAYCLRTFIHNTYEAYRPASILQFFLANFGEGITNCYLRPYNEKIWKFDPAFMDIQMVERIPKPPPEDIIRSAQGAATEGYTHQLYFYYPRCGGIAALPQALRDRLGPKTTVRLAAAAARVSREGKVWKVADAQGRERVYDRLVSTIPLPELAGALSPALPAKVSEAIRGLRYNSIIICAMRFKRDSMCDNFAVMVPDKETIFHRVSKLDFLRPRGRKDEASTLMAEITFRAGDLISDMSDGEVRARVLHDLSAAGLVPGDQKCLATAIRRFTYAYVIYDFNHRRHLRTLREYLEGKLGIVLCGRFGEFEYLNMDTAVSNARSKVKAVVGQT